MTNYETGSRTADKFVVRMPEGLRSQVEIEANASDRSMNAVAVRALKEYLSGRLRKKALLDALERATVDESRVNQIALEGESVNQTTQIPGSLITENPAVTESMHIDDRVKAAAAEEMFLTVVFRLPNTQAADQLVKQLPYGQKALGTEAEVFGLTTGNLMEVEPCES